MLLRSLTGTVTAAVLILTSSASAQFFGGGCSTCGTSRPVTNVASCGTCTPIRPVYSACYQTIPVTTYRKERQTVREPYYKTAYEDREVTVYEPVTRKKTIEVPTVSYKTVVENRTVHRDLGRWQTNYTPVAKCAPCQIDPRPGLLGWLNRTGYSIRSSFTPDYRTTRQYVPNMVACSVPVSRQVAVRGTRKVVVNDTEMVARKKTERVEVRRLAWRDREITVSRPVTAYRTVPVGTATAFGYGYPGTSVARIIDEGETREARRATPDDNFRGTRGAFRDDDDLRDEEKVFERDRDNSVRQSGFEREVREPLVPPEEKPKPAFDEDDIPIFDGGVRKESRKVIPALARQPVASTGGWKARPAGTRTVTADSANLKTPVASRD